MSAKETMSWRDTWRESDELTALGLTKDKRDQGRFGLAGFEAGIYPACSRHGAMNRVSMPGHGSLWRCLHLECNIGCEWKTPSTPSSALGARQRKDVEAAKSLAHLREALERIAHEGVNFGPPKGPGEIARDALKGTR